MVARGVTEEDMATLNATPMNEVKFAELVAGSSVVSF